MDGGGMGEGKLVGVSLDEIFGGHDAGEEEAEQTDGDGDVHVEFALGGVLGVGEHAEESERETEPDGDERGGMQWTRWR